MSGGEERVPKGYKQTEVGVIPEDWELKTFGEIFDFKSTASNSRSDLTESDSTHYIHYGDIHTVFHRHLNLEKRDTPMISRELCKNAALVRNGDWVMADASEDYSGICKAIEISGITNESSVVAGLHTFLLRDREGTYVPDFKGHLGEAKYLHDQYVRVSVGLKVFGVTKRSLRDLFIPVPPKQEQSSIEEILTDSDSQIQVLENLISKKRDIKQGTMQELLTGKTRLPGFTGEWFTTALLDLVDSSRAIRYGIVQPGNFDQYGRYMIRGQDYSFAKGWASPSEIFKVSDKVEKKYKNARVKTGDLIMTIVGYCGHVEEIPDWLNGANLTQTTARIAIHPSKANSRYCRYALMSEFCQRQVGYFIKGAAQPGLNCGDVQKFVLQMPPSISEQEAIAEVLSDMDAEIAALEKRLEKTKAIKQGMMQQLLTGRIRLVDPGTPVEASA